LRAKSSNKPGYLCNSYTDSPTLFSKSFFETSKILGGFEIVKFSRGALLSSQTSQSKAQKFQKTTTHFYHVFSNLHSTTLELSILFRNKNIPKYLCI